MQIIERELMAIICTYKNIFKMYKDKIHSDLFIDIGMKELLAVLQENVDNDNFTIYTLMARFGESLPMTERATSDCLLRVDTVIAQLEQDALKRNLNAICVDYNRTFMSSELVNVDDFIAKVGNLQIAGSDYEMFDTRDFLDDVEKSIEPANDPSLNTMVGDFKYGTVAYLAGRPGMWKTTAAINMHTQLVKSGRRGIIFSLEMSKKQIHAIQQQIITEQLYKDVQSSGTLQYGALENVYEYTALSKGKSFITDYSRFSVTGMERAINKVKLQHGKVDYIIVDNLNLIQRRNGVSEYEAISEITRELKILANALGIVVICIAHLNRANSERNNKRAKLSDLRGSGSIEQDADYVIFLHREDYYYYEQGSTPPEAIKNVLEYHQAKNRFDNPENGLIRISLSLQKAYDSLNDMEEVNYKKALIELTSINNSKKNSF